jgi:hypothetical protein
MFYLDAAFIIIFFLVVDFRKWKQFQHNTSVDFFACSEKKKKE